MVPVALVSVLVAGLAVVTVVLLSGPGGLSGGKTSNSPVGTVAARAQAASSVTKGSKWLTGSGARLLTAVNADLGKVTIARHAGNARRGQGRRSAAGLGCQCRAGRVDAAGGCQSVPVRAEGPQDGWLV